LKKSQKLDAIHASQPSNIPTLKDFCHSKKGAPILEEAKKHGPSVAEFLTDAIGLVDKGTPRTKVPRFSEPSGGHAGQFGHE